MIERLCKFLAVLAFMSLAGPILLLIMAILVIAAPFVILLKPELVKNPFGTCTLCGERAPQTLGCMHPECPKQDRDQ